ncbi:hypothetical protein [Pseudomonas turukhanskensis]|uniref:Uncharacterized protein n=1 Tax=Pseudomonas turukhanskensis TaxID=1806536 RepID=A0A9W6K8K0_9PSED|nr:hypothetical protein [Pseudomonas turukhanskensis]GLK90216.1 hypothetical protein GCM10017655_32780 [Pseudomonas turukhanskensis]
MNIPTSLKHARTFLSAVAFSFLALTGLANTAYADDVRLSTDSYSGVTSKDSATYLDCVSGSVSYNERVFTSSSRGQSRLLTSSADPLQARGIVEVTEVDGVNHFSAHQRDAWQDKGALLSAAQLCAHS